MANPYLVDMENVMLWTVKGRLYAVLGSLIAKPEISSMRTNLMEGQIPAMELFIALRITTARSKARSRLIGR